MSISAREVGVRYTVPRRGRGWELSEETVPESIVHDHAVELLKAILVAWAARLGRAVVARNLAVRWEKEDPRIGADPDICVLSPPPPKHEDLRSLRTWEEGQHAPILAVEVVSETNATKDYAIAPDKYAACGVGELWVFDPLLSGPTAYGGPHRLQVWVRDAAGDLSRVYAGDGPAHSPTLDAYLVVVAEGRKLRISDDREGSRFWTSPEESERAAKKAALADKDAALADKDAALARIAELEAELEKRRP